MSNRNNNNHKKISQNAKLLTFPHFAERVPKGLNPK
jgi:hypothetical protein